MTTKPVDYLAVIFIAGGSSWSFASSQEEAVRRCVKCCQRDWSGLFQLAGEPVPVNVYDVKDVDEVHFDHRCIVFDKKTAKPLSRIAVVDATFAGKKKRAA